MSARASGPFCLSPNCIRNRRLLNWTTGKMPLSLPAQHACNRSLSLAESARHTIGAGAGQQSRPAKERIMKTRLFLFLAIPFPLLAMTADLLAQNRETGPAAGRVLAQTTGLDAIQHVIVIYQENWSFDGLYGKFPGADGIANAGDRVKQIKKDGTPYLTLPQPLDTAKKPPIPDPRFPADLPVAPYDAARFVPPDQKKGDIVNHALQEERQINGGRMDGFVGWSDNAGLALSYYDATEMPVGRLAQQYTLADRFFPSALSGSLLTP